MVTHSPARPRESGDPEPSRRKNWIPAYAGMSGRGCDASSTSFREPAARTFHQRLAQARMLDALDRLADEGLDQQRPGPLARNAARAQIEQEVVVERAGGRAVAALHRVREAFELPLVVGLGLLRAA